MPIYAAPARAEDLTGLPPTCIDVAQLDIFRNEDLDHAQRLARAGVSVERHTYPDVPHSLKLFAPESAITQQVQQDRVRFLRSL